MLINKWVCPLHSFFHYTGAPKEWGMGLERKLLKSIESDPNNTRYKVITKI